MKTQLVAVCLRMSANAMNASVQEPVSYHSVRIENVDVFYREAGLKEANSSFAPRCPNILAQVSADAGIVSKSSPSAIRAGGIVTIGALGAAPYPIGRDAILHQNENFEIFPLKSHIPV